MDREDLNLGPLPYQHCPGTRKSRFEMTILGSIMCWAAAVCDGVAVFVAVMWSWEQIEHGTAVLYTCRIHRLAST